jgi:hypothetical protein
MPAALALVLDESKWLTVSLTLATLAVWRLVSRVRDGAPTTRSVVSAAMNLFFGVTIGAMAFGHLFAVTLKLWLGTLEGSRLVFYAIGFALAIPSWWMIRHAPRLAKSPAAQSRAVILNAMIATTLLVMGWHNLPLAAPAALNIGYAWHSRPRVGQALLAAAVVVNAGLFVGSLVFLASGQSFEQFRGIE